MAKIVSNCAETREEGGSVGWVNLSETFHDDTTATNNNNNNNNNNNEETKKNPNEHLNQILPPSARQDILTQNTKPGDIVLVQSHRGVHLVQVVDVMVDVRKLSHVQSRDRNNKKKNKKNNNDGYMIGRDGEQVVTAEALLLQKKSSKLAGVMGGALLDDTDNTNGNIKKIDLTYKIETMGCQMNSADSERIEGQLMSLGIRPLMEDEYTEEEEVTSDNDGLMKESKLVKKEKKKPDVIVLNTCSIRDHAEQKVYS